MAFSSDEIDLALIKILGDPEAVSTLQALAESRGINEPFAQLDRDQQVELVTQLLNMARAANDRDEKGIQQNVANEIPIELAQQIIANTRADAILRSIMESNELTGDPVDLPLEIKTAIVKFMIKEGMVSFDQQ